MTILCYHSVDPAWWSPIAVAPEEFEAHCGWMARRRSAIPLEMAAGAAERRLRLGRDPIAITFDDGFSDLYDHAFPCLARHRLPATVFLVAEMLTAEGRAVDWVDDPPDHTLRMLTIDQVLEMQEAGISFGSHSFTHKDLTTLGFDGCTRDLRASKDLLESVLGREVPFVAYPRGRHDETVRHAAERVGFTHGFALPDAREPKGRYSIPRVGIYRGNGVRVVRMKTSRFYLGLRTSPIYPWLRKAVGKPSLPRPPV